MVASKLRAVIGVHGGQQGHFVEEVLVSLAPLLRRVLDDGVEGVAVELPDHAGRLGLNRGLAGRQIEQRELAEDVAWTANLDALLDAVWVPDEAVEGAALDEHEAVAVVALLDDPHARLRVDL